MKSKTQLKKKAYWAGYSDGRNSGRLSGVLLGAGIACIWIGILLML